MCCVRALGIVTRVQAKVIVVVCYWFIGDDDALTWARPKQKTIAPIPGPYPAPVTTWGGGGGEALSRALDMIRE